MSKHWRPDEDAALLRSAKDAGGGPRDWARLQSYLHEQVKPQPLPQGAKAGLVLVAIACMGVAFGIYQAFGPREVIAPGAEAGWSAAEEAARR